MNNTSLIYIQILIILCIIGRKYFFRSKHFVVLAMIIVVYLISSIFLSEFYFALSLGFYYLLIILFSYLKFKSLFLSAIYFLIQNSLLIIIWTVAYDFPLLLFNRAAHLVSSRDYFLIYSIQGLLLLILISYIYYLNKHYELWDLLSNSNKKRTFLSLAIIISNNVLLLHRQYLAIFPVISDYFYLSLILLSYSIFFIFMIIIVNKMNEDKLFIKNLTKKSKENTRFIKLSNEFQHDFKTFLYTVSYYLKINDIEGLENYIGSLKNYSEKFLNHSLFNQVELIDYPAIQGLLIMCIEECEKNDIQLSLNIQTLSHKSFLSSIDFTRCLSILLNNAIEHSSSKIYVSFYDSNDILFCSVKNTVSQPVPIDKIFKRSYSTKEKHQGIGLSILTNIINSYQNTHLSVEKNNNWISFTISHSE